MMICIELLEPELTEIRAYVMSNHVIDTKVGGAPRIEQPTTRLLLMSTFDLALDLNSSST